MNQKRTILILFITTGMALSYVHLTTANIILSYNIRSSEEKYHRLLDYTSYLRYNTNKLATCSNLEIILVAQNAKLSWPTERKVVTLASETAYRPFQNETVYRPFQNETVYRPVPSMGPYDWAKRQIASIFSIKREAQASPVRNIKRQK